jgi:hypothetical protein
MGQLNKGLCHTPFILLVIQSAGFENIMPSLVVALIPHRTSASVIILVNIVFQYAVHEVNKRSVYNSPQKDRE